MRARRPAHAIAVRSQAGVTLIIAMVMLAVIGFTSVAIMRNTLSNDQVALGTRSQGQALQYAQAALRFCESRAWAHASEPAVLPPATPPRWMAFATWRAGAAYTLTRADLAAGAAAFPDHPPQCLAEARAGDGGTPLTIVTARGMSLDFAEDASGRTRNGAVAWLQSVSTPGGEQRSRRQLLTPPTP